MARPEQEHWLVRPTTIRLLWATSIAILAALVALDLVVTHHPHFSLESTFGFGAWFGGKKSGLDSQLLRLQLISKTSGKGESTVRKNGDTLNSAIRTCLGNLKRYGNRHGLRIKGIIVAESRWFLSDPA